MKANDRLALAAIAGISIGVGGGEVIRAQQVKTSPAYVIAEVGATGANPADLKKYAEKMPESLAPFNHRYLVRGGKTQSLEGEPPKSIVVIAFDSMEKAREWYGSAAYEAVKPLRQSSTQSRIFIAEGVAPQ